MARYITSPFELSDSADLQNLMNTFDAITAICNGVLIKHVIEKSGLTKSQFDADIRRVDNLLTLPGNKSDYPKHKDKILSNIALWKQYKKKIDALRNKILLLEDAFLSEVVHIPVIESLRSFDDFYRSAWKNSRNGNTDAWTPGHMKRIQSILNGPYMQSVCKIKGWSKELGLEYVAEFLDSDGFSLAQFMEQKPAS